MNYALEVDAAEVLGVSHDATLHQIHEAYRARAKKHHPDVGGEDWAFRLVARSYELLSNARLRNKLADCWPWIDSPDPETSSERQPRDWHSGEHEPEPERTYERNFESPPEQKPPSPPDHESSWVRAGFEDRVDDKGKLVEIEIFTIRYELGGPLDLLGAAEDRNLSSCVTVTWPVPPHHDHESDIEPDPADLKRLRKAFDPIARKTKAVSSWSKSKDGRFQGWLSYPTANQSGKAFALLHQNIRDAGMGVRQLTREMFIARETR